MSRSSKQVVYVRESSQAVPALVSVFLPGFGHLIQGRVIAAFGWWIALTLAALSMLVVVGFVLFPLLWIWCIVDTARYRG